MKKSLAKSQADLSVFFTLKDFFIHLLFKPFSLYLYPILLIYLAIFPSLCLQEIFGTVVALKISTILKNYGAYWG